MRQLRARNCKLQRDHRILLGVQKASAAVASLLDPAQALHEIAVRALEVIGGSSAVIFTVSEDGESLEPRALAGDIPNEQAQPLPHLRTATEGWRVVCERGLIVGDAASHPYLARIWPQLAERRVKSLIAVPLVARGSAIGLLTVTNKRRKRAFAPRDLRVLRLFADQAALALDNSRLYVEAADRSAHAHAQLQLVRQVLDIIRDPVALLDYDGHVAFGNQALFSLLGREPSHVIGHDWYEFAAADDVDAVRAQYEAAGEGAIVTSDARIVRADGSLVPLRVRYGTSSNGKGRAPDTFVALVDFEDRQRMEGRLNRRARMMEALVRLTRAIGTTLDPLRLAVRTLGAALILPGLKRGVIYLIEDGEFVLAASQGMSARYIAQAQRLRIEGTVSARPRGWQAAPVQRSAPRAQSLPAPGALLSYRHLCRHCAHSRARRPHRRAGPGWR